MAWRVWSLVAGLPLGALAAWGIDRDASAAALSIAAFAAAVLLLFVVSLIARYRDDDPARGAHLAAGASVALVAVPALAAVLPGLEPGPAWWTAIVSVLLALALVRGARLHGPTGGLRRQLVAAGLAILGGGVAVLALAVTLGALTGGGPVVSEAGRAAVYDIDASVATRALPVCGARPARVETLLDRGARPRLDRRARRLWFDAEVEGRRQIHRLDLATRRLHCWTCGEPGDNLRPHPGVRRPDVVFETDRHATWSDPTNSEIHLIRGGGEAPGSPSQRLTFAAGPDDHALLAPAPGVLTWSRRRGAAYEVVSASMRDHRGGPRLESARVLVRVGSEWGAPTAWSSDARALVVLLGNPLRSLVAQRIDLATGEVYELAHDATGGGVAFATDGGWVAVAGARRQRIAGLLPSWMGGVLAPLAAATEREGPLLRETRIRFGPREGALESLELGELEKWGEPTGLAVSPDATRLYLAQRRHDATGRQERILEITLDCGSPAPGNRTPSR